MPDESSQNDQQPAQIEAATSVPAAATSVSEASSQEDQQQAQAEAETADYPELDYDPSDREILRAA